MNSVRSQILLPALDEVHLCSFGGVGVPSRSQHARGAAYTKCRAEMLLVPGVGTCNWCQPRHAYNKKTSCSHLIRCSTDLNILARHFTLFNTDYILRVEIHRSPVLMLTFALPPTKLELHLCFLRLVWGGTFRPVIIFAPFCSPTSHSRSQQTHPHHVVQQKIETGRHLQAPHEAQATRRLSSTRRKRPTSLRLQTRRAIEHT